MLRADNRGEGGILALMALAVPRRRRQAAADIGSFVLGLFGAALLYGDGMITPAISVLSAVEGLEVAAPRSGALSSCRSTIVILVGLFAVQRRGTGGVGALFGPSCSLWFWRLAAARDLRSIVQHARSAAGARARCTASRFCPSNGWPDFWCSARCSWSVTGGEALYADMGHFGARPIRLTWFAVVLPALLLNYFGQGALLLRGPERRRRTRSSAWCPSWALYPMVALATVGDRHRVAGADLGRVLADAPGHPARLLAAHARSCTPRREQIGQIYVPDINWLLMLARDRARARASASSSSSPPRTASR